MKKLAHTVLPAIMAGVLMAGTALAGDCTGYVVGVQPLTQYDHAAGYGFLAVRSGPGTGFNQIGELYLGDVISVWERQATGCMSTACPGDA